MSGTSTRTQTSTYTEARARYVLQKAFDDLVALMTNGFITKDTALEWYRVTKHIADMEALLIFQLKMKVGDQVVKAWQYEVSSDGTLLEDSESGGLAFDDVPSNSKVSICLKLSEDSVKNAKAWEYLRSQGWGEGQLLKDGMKQDRAFSKDGYGLRRSVFEMST